MDKFRTKIMLEQVRDQLHIERNLSGNIQKSQLEDINPFDKFEEDIQKGKKATIGETRIWNGKKMRKQANGKWVEVSDYKMTKKEHEFQLERTKESMSGYKDSHGYQEHLSASKKLSDKEYDDSELEEGGEDKPKYTIGTTYHLPAPEGGEAIDMKIIGFKNNQYKVETSNKEGRKGTHTFNPEIVEELINLGKKRK